MLEETLNLPVCGLFLMYFSTMCFNALFVMMVNILAKFSANLIMFIFMRFPTLCQTFLFYSAKLQETHKKFQSYI